MGSAKLYARTKLIAREMLKGTSSKEAVSKANKIYPLSSTKTSTSSTGKTTEKPVEQQPVKEEFVGAPVQTEAEKRAKQEEIYNRVKAGMGFGKTTLSKGVYTASEWAQKKQEERQRWDIEYQKRQTYRESLKKSISEIEPSAQYQYGTLTTKGVWLKPMLEQELTNLDLSEPEFEKGYSAVQIQHIEALNLPPTATIKSTGEGFIIDENIDYKKWKREQNKQRTWAANELQMLGAVVLNLPDKNYWKAVVSGKGSEYMYEKEYNIQKGVQQGDFWKEWRNVQAPAYETVIIPMSVGAVWGAGSTVAHSFLEGAGRVGASHLITAGEIAVGTAMVTPTVVDIGTDFYKGDYSKAFVETGFLGIQVGGGYAGYKEATNVKFKFGLPKGSKGYTIGQWGTYKGRMSFINTLEKNMGKIETGVLKPKGGTVFKKTSYGMIEKGGKWAEIRYNVPKYEKLIGISKEQASIWRDVTKLSFKEESIFGGGRVSSLETQGGLIGQKKMGSRLFTSAETMKGKPELVEFMEKKVRTSTSEEFGGVTYKTAEEPFTASHDIDIAFKNLTKDTFDITYFMKGEVEGIDIKPLVKEGKIITTSRAVKEAPYDIEGVSIMTHGETTSRLIDASWMPTAKRISPEGVPKDIASASTMIARRHYRAKWSGDETLTNLALTSRQTQVELIEAFNKWEKNPVVMTSAMEEQLFGKNIHQKWAEFWSETLVTPEKKIPSNLPMQKTIVKGIKYYSQKLGGTNIKEIMKYDMKSIKDLPPTPKVTSQVYTPFNVIYYPSGRVSTVPNIKSVSVKSKNVYSPSYSVSSSYIKSISLSPSVSKQISLSISPSLSKYVSPSISVKPSSSSSISQSMSVSKSISPSVSSSMSSSTSSSKSNIPSYYMPSYKMFGRGGKGFGGGYKGYSYKLRTKKMGLPFDTKMGDKMIKKLVKVKI